MYTVYTQKDGVDFQMEFDKDFPEDKAINTFRYRVASELNMFIYLEEILVSEIYEVEDNVNK